MPKTPEGKFTTKVRNLWRFMYPEILIYKHSDRFNGGIADLHFILPSGKIAWVELKWIKQVKRRVKCNVSDLQVEFLMEHAEKGIPSYVMIGTNGGWGCAWYRIEDFDGYIHRKDMKLTEHQVHELVDEVVNG